MKRNLRVKLIRNNLPTFIKHSLPDYVYWNAGTIYEVSEDKTRVGVKWNDEDKYWFDANALEIVKG